MCTHSCTFWALYASLYVYNYVIYKSPLRGVFHVYTTRERRPEHMQTSNSWGLRFVYVVHCMHWSIQCLLQLPHVLHDFNRPPLPTVNTLVWTYQLHPFCTANWCLQLVHDIVHHLSPLQVALLQKMWSVVEHVREPIHRLVHCMCAHWEGYALIGRALVHIRIATLTSLHVAASS